jgi:branched-chain amino acid transport system substrate-binding protein
VTICRPTLIALALSLSAGAALAQTQGVSKDEIVLGSIQDLSGPLAGFGKSVRQGMVLRVDEINEQGGINGRKIKLLVEDSKYDPRNAVLAAQKLVNQEKIFAMVAHLGTAQNMAAMPVQFQKNVVNFLPVTAAREMYEPFHKLKFANIAPYYEFGLEVMRGAEEGLKAVNMTMVEKTSFKRGATDFASQVARMKAANCDFIVLGTIIRETIGTIATARKLDYNPTFFGSQAAYTDLIHKLGGPAMNGLYATMTTQHPYLDEAAQPIRFWANKYKTKFNEDPNVFSVYGYNAIDIFARAAGKAGPNLTTDSFVKTMDSLTVPGDIFGSPELRFNPQRRYGSMAMRLSQIQDGRWKVTSDYVNK